MASNVKIFGVRFAPLNVSLERRLQTVATALWIVVMAFGDFWGYLAVVYLLLHSNMTLTYLLLYFTWIYYDWDTCNRGGRSEWWIRWAKNNALWRYFCKFFPVKLVKTADLDPGKLHLFISVPHGILSTGITGAFGTDVLGCKQLFPGLDVRVIALDQHFKVPFFREYMYSVGGCASNAKSIEYLLSTPPKEPFTGRATILIVGGALESLESRPGTYRTVINRRKGFVKLALKHGAPLVPVVSFGETDVYDQLYSPEGTLFRRLQNYIRKHIGLAPVIFSGRGFFQYSFGLIPNRSPITVVVGSPLDLPKIEHPTTEQIDEYHKKFTDHLVELFETQKHNYVKDADTTFLELDC